MKVCIWIFILLFPFITISILFCEEKMLNNGENIVKPVTRVDTRLEFQKGAQEVKGRSTILTLRIDKAMNLPYYWQLALRMDLPYEWFYCPSDKNFVSCNNAFRTGDTLTQLFIITPPQDKWTGAFGVQVIFPTAGSNTNIGDGKYELHPSVALVYDLRNWSEGSFVGFILRQAFSIAGYKTAPSINQTYIQPLLNINLPHHWFINSSPEFRYNWETRVWFVPFDVMIGKMLAKNLVASVEYEYALINDFPRYQQEVEFRLGYFF